MTEGRGRVKEDVDNYRQKFDALFDEFEEIKAACPKVYQEAADTRRTYDIAYETAYKAAEGTIPEKKAEAVTATAQLRKTMDDAEVLERVLKLRFSALENQLSAVQSAAKVAATEDALSRYTT
jgi:uncharacterized coiled-coil DUF342 family protein